MFASKLFRKAAIAGLAAALFCAPAQSFAKETVKVGFIGPLTGGILPGSGIRCVSFRIFRGSLSAVCFRRR